jgi:5-methylcytosine-specific restriction endonuclease McrBC regulatory subunit McrC
VPNESPCIPFPHTERSSENTDLHNQQSNISIVSTNNLPGVLRQASEKPKYQYSIIDENFEAKAEFLPKIPRRKIKSKTNIEKSDKDFNLISLNVPTPGEDDDSESELDYPSRD